MEKQNYRAGLKATSIVYLALAVIDLALVALSWGSGDYDVAAQSAASGLPESTVSTLLYVMLGLTVVTVLVKVWLGVAGIRQVNGKPVGRAHIVLGTIVAVLTTIGFVLDLIGVCAGTLAESDAAVSAGSTMIALMYVIYAKGVLRTSC